MHVASEQGGGRPTIEAWNAVSRAARPVIRELLVTGPRSRTELARLLGLSTGSLTRLTKPLVRSGLLVERETRHDPINGRPTFPLDIVTNDFHFLGVKLTSDWMYAVITDLRAEVVAEHAEPLQDRTPEGVAAQARVLMDRMARENTRPVAAGFTVGGNSSVGDDTAGSALFDVPWLDWWRVPLESVLNDAMGIPCVVRNDVFALAYGQNWFGLARGLSDFAVVAVGPGIGYALCLNGRVLAIPERGVVEFGHHILDPGGPMCPVGHRGCVSSYLSSGAILSAATHGLRRPVALDEIAPLAEAGDAVCQDIVRQAGRALGMLVATVSNLTGVKTVVVAGETVDVVRGGERHLREGLSQRRFLDPHSIDTPMLSSSFTEWARGGAVEAIRAFVVEGD
ncbi:ROK family protein [Streptomyces sp. 4N509B]|uniref:ROK family protein n=1 Tax=Streptomyces sp. 4N509B TaxID=3457413 RepID=UPI003FD27561